jgi:hypothetical protein
MTCTRPRTVAHLAIASHERGHLEEAERELVASAAQRRSLGFTAGVAANLVGLSYIALGRGDRYQAMRYAHDAIAAALAIGAAKVLADAEEALASMPSWPAACQPRGRSACLVGRT